MFKRTSTPARKNFDSIEHRLLLKKKSKGIQTEDDGQNNKIVNDMLMEGKNMNDDDFEKFIRVHAFDCYWKILAERARVKLEDQLRENRQLHEILDELNKENEQLQTKNEQCEYLTNVFNSIISEHDSGVESYLTEESPGFKRAKLHI